MAASRNGRALYWGITTATAGEGGGVAELPSRTLPLAMDRTDSPSVAVDGQRYRGMQCGMQPLFANAEQHEEFGACRDQLAQAASAKAW